MAKRKRHNPEKRGSKWHGSSYKAGGKRVSDLKNKADLKTRKAD